MFMGLKKEKRRELWSIIGRKPIKDESKRRFLCNVIFFSKLLVYRKKLIDQKNVLVCTTSTTKLLLLILLLHIQTHTREPIISREFPILLVCIRFRIWKNSIGIAELDPLGSKKEQ